jgi:F-type H+-transporting ATPase subunit delta
VGQTAVALRYAEALYELAQEAGRTAAVLTDLASVKAALDANPELWRKLLHPRTSTAEKVALLEQSVLAGKDRLVANTFRLIVQRRRESMLGGFFREYLDVHERREGILRVEVDTAKDLRDSEQEQLRERLAAATGQAVVLEPRTVPELLGGMRLRVGSRLVDGSLKTRLDKIARGLHEAPLASG